MSKSQSKFRSTADALKQPIRGGNAQKKMSAKEFLEEASGHELMRLIEKLSTPEISLAEYFTEITGHSIEPWQRHLCNRLELLKHQTGQRLLIHKPPQFGGSTIVSRCLPSYMLGMDPLFTFRQCTHNQEHSEEFSDDVIAIIEGQEFQDIFPGTKLPKQKNVTEWSTMKKLEQRRRRPEPSYKAIGIAGSAVGVGGKLFCIDDPYGSPNDAHSAAYNKEVRRWHSELLTGRLTPESNVIVMFHRYHPNDYAGWLESRGGWEVIRYAALADGEKPKDPLGRQLEQPLSPRYPWEYLNDLRESDPMTFYGQYQGRPENPEGNAVKRSWFPFQFDYDEEGIPAFDIRKSMGAMIYFDVAASEKGDETVGTLGCAMPDQSWTWLWQMTGNWGPAERDLEIVKFCSQVRKAMHVQVFLEEGIGLGKETVDRIVMKIRAAGIPADVIRSKGSKWERANNRQDSFRSSAEARRIRLYCGDLLREIGMTNQRVNCWEPYLREVTQLQLKKVGDIVKLVGKDNKWDSGTGLHNALLKLSERVITSMDRAALGKRFGGR